MAERKIRVLIGKPGLDGHDRGAKIIARSLRDAGFEVVYTGLHQTPEMIASAALQEDVDAVGLSVLSGAHNFVFPEIRRLLDSQGMEEVLLFGGGTVPEIDVPTLLKQGVAALFTPCASTEDVAKFLREHVSPRE